MTLITYITRVHFADGIVEEALRSELEVNGKKHPFVVVEKCGGTDRQDIVERVLEGMPPHFPYTIHEYDRYVPHETAVFEIAERFKTKGCDVFIAIGSNTIIDVGKVSRIATAHGEPISRFTIAEAGSRRIVEKPLPDLYAIPNIDGFCSAISAHAKILQENGVHARVMCRKLVPTVTICDPTLTSGVDAYRTASSGVDAIARCLEAYLSPNYNPPADGIAFDGLRRAMEYLPKVLRSDDPLYRREMMAASLNSALALQKGLGTTQVISDGLQEACNRPLDLGAIRRVLLPKVIACKTNMSADKMNNFADLLDVEDCEEIPGALETFLSGLPLPNTLSKLDIDQTMIGSAATIASKAMVSAPGMLVSDRNSIEKLILEPI